MLDLGELDPAVGLVGDTWDPARQSAHGRRVGAPGHAAQRDEPRLVEFVAQDPEREALAGDQLFLDLDLSQANLPTWSRLTFGEPATAAVIEVTDQPHNGCASSSRASARTR